MISKKQRDEDRRICAAATPQWRQAHHVGEPKGIYAAATPRDSLLGLDRDGMAIFGREEDAHAAVSAVNALPNYIEALDEIERLVRERLKQHRENLADWKEPDGLLVPTEPDPDERRLVRERLKAAIFELATLLGEEPGVEVS